ncbi:MAG: sugar phosphate isomerase/epimerase [Verrucomicrobiae bacterium]|nr:sugar phosphate isomerase/epimerase [Verrucomicrobiae bacterium]
MKKHKMIFGIVSDVYGIKHPLPETLRRLSKNGFKAVEIVSEHVCQLTGHSALSSRKTSSKKNLFSVRKMCDDLGLIVWQVHGPYGNLDLVADRGRVQKNNVDSYKRWIDHSILLGAKTLIVHPGGRSDVCQTKDTDLIKNENAASLMKLIGHIGKEDFKLAVENLPSRSAEHPHIFNRFCNKITELNELLSLLKSDKAGICLDTGHANLENLDVVVAVGTAGKNLIATHINENNAVHDLHMFPFSLREKYSRLNWFEIFGAFKDIRYSHPLIGECANSTGELPLWLCDSYLRHQRELVEKAANES